MESIWTLTIENAMMLAYEHEINIGMQSFFDSGIDVWIGDAVNGKRAAANFGADDIADIPAWIDSNLRALYPDIARDVAERSINR